MTSSVPPIYIVNDFNSAFFPSSTNLTSSYLSSNCNYLLRKNTPDTATAQESFQTSGSGGLTGLFVNSIEPITKAGGTMNLFTSINKTISLYVNTLSGNISFLTSGNINLGNKSATTGVNNFRSKTTLAYPITVISTAPPTALHIGCITSKTNSRTSSTSTSVAGTYPLYTGTTSLTAGMYLITMTGTLTNGGLTSGSITALSAGYTYGSSATASSNSPFSQYSTNITLTPTNSQDVIFSYSVALAQPNTTTQYVAGFITYTQTTLTGATTLASIHNFSVIRIG
jgi:hypothetical protein